jgi:hypothetical protein
VFPCRCALHSSIKFLIAVSNASASVSSSTMWCAQVAIVVSPGGYPRSSYYFDRGTHLFRKIAAHWYSSHYVVIWPFDPGRAEQVEANRQPSQIVWRCPAGFEVETITLTMACSIVPAAAPGGGKGTGGRGAEQAAILGNGGELEAEADWADRGLHGVYPAAPDSATLTTA